MQHGAGGGGDDTDAVGEGRKWALARGVEEALSEQAGFELFEGELECARAKRFEGFGDELELAALFVDGDAAAREHREAILRAKAEELCAIAEEDDGQLRVAVLEGEIEMAGGGGAAVGDFTFDEDVWVIMLEAAADGGDEFGDGEDAAGWGLWRRRCGYREE